MRTSNRANRKPEPASVSTLVPILAGLIPSFGLVVLGGLVRRMLTEAAWIGVDRLNFNILFPALLFVSAAARPIAVEDALRIGPAVWAILGAGLVLGWFARSAGPERFLDFAGTWQLAWRFNTAIAFVAVGVMPGGDVGIMAVAVGMAVPMANLLAVSALSRGGSLGPLETVRRIVLNPYLLSSAGGVAVGLSGLTVPTLVMAPLNMLAQAAIPVALLSVGATMRWSALGRLDRFTGVLNATKLLALPALVWGLSRLIGAEGALVSHLIVFAAIPTSSGAHVLASAFGADRVPVATIIAQSTLIGAVTLPIWIALA